MAGVLGRKGRGRLSNIQLLPRECESIVAWAAQELQANARSQTDIYGEFVGRLEALKAEYRGELEFTVPSFTGFNRYSQKLAEFANEITSAREMAQAIGQHVDAEGEDDLTRIAAMAIKSLVTNIMVARGSKGLDPKGAANLATALRAAAQAEGVSTARRQKVEAEFAKDVDKAVDQVAKVKGLTAETAEAIKSQILGVRS